MTNRESILLKLLIIIFILASFFLITSNLYTVEKDSKQEINTYSNSLKKLNSEKKLLAQSNSVQTVSVQSKKSLSTCTALIIDALKKYNITPKRYSISESKKDPYTEILFNCDSASFFSFLFNSLKETTPYTINYFSIEKIKSSVSITLRISTSTCYKLSSNTIFTSPYILSNLFFNPKRKEEKPQQKTQSEIIDGNSLFTIIGSITSGKGFKTLYLKNLNTGQIYNLSSDQIQKKDNFYIFTIDDTIYKITISENSVK